jgi:hypothetical protein
MSANQMATQNVWQHHFPQPCGGMAELWENWITEVVAELGTDHRKMTR